jgi:hypothetical protein
MGVTARQTWWHRFWAVCLFRCAGASPEIPEIFPEIPNFPETVEKSSEYPDFTDKFVLSIDLQDSHIQPPSRRHQDPFAMNFTMYSNIYKNDYVSKTMYKW